MPRTASFTPADLLTFLRARGPLSGPELVAGLRLSQPTLSRLLRAAGRSVVKAGSARKAVYAARRELRGLGETIPVFRVSSEGHCGPFGELIPVSPGYLWQPKSGPAQFFPGIPFFLSDHRPQGFMGRTFAARHPELALPGRMIDWSDDDTMEALCRRGEDAPGDLLVGRESFERYQRARLAGGTLLSGKQIEAHYRLAATAALESDMPGSSAGGEQPKFTLSFRDGGEIAHAIVKFSPRQSDFRGQRWMDLLLGEALALELLGNAGVSAARARWRQLDRRAFLEVRRFDRVGERGRVGVLTLGPLDDEWFGRRDNWVAAAGRLEARGALSPADARTIRFLYSFGGLIANSDRHFGNLGFFFSPGVSELRLAPAYDMLPMLYAPAAIDAEERTVRFQVEPPHPDAAEEWSAAFPLALEFWARMAKDERVSKGFRAIAKGNHALLKQAG